MNKRAGMVVRDGNGETIMFPDGFRLLQGSALLQGTAVRALFFFFSF